MNLTERNIIAIHGKKGSGKSTAADYLCQIGYKRYKFATVLKSMTEVFLREAFAMTDSEIAEAIEGKTKEVPIQLGDASFTPRHAMQTLGTEWGRKCLSSSLWPDILATHILKSDDKFIVIDDLRFDNENEWVKNIGATSIEIFRPGVSDIDPEHESEHRVSCDYTIINSGTIHTLENDIATLLDRIERKSK